MAVRERLSSLLERTVAELRSAFSDDATSDRGATPSILEGRVSAVETALADHIAELEARLAALAEADARLEKRLSMTMGAIQAATAQLLELKEGLAQAQNQAQQAMQRATTAQTTAESAAEGTGAVEAGLAELQHRGRATKPT